MPLFIYLSIVFLLCLILLKIDTHPQSELAAIFQFTLNRSDVFALRPQSDCHNLRHKKLPNYFGQRH